MYDFRYSKPVVSFSDGADRNFRRENESRNPAGMAAKSDENTFPRIACREKPIRLLTR